MTGRSEALTAGLARLVGLTTGLPDTSPAFPRLLCKVQARLGGELELDPDERRLQAAVDRVHEAFVTLSEPDKAAAWRSQIARICQDTVPTFPRVEVRCAMVSLLVALAAPAGCPSHLLPASALPASTSLLADAAVCGVGSRWPAKETTSIPTGHGSDFSESEDFCPDEGKELHLQPFSREDSGIQVDVTPSEEAPSQPRLRSVQWIATLSEDRRWLEKSVVQQYWTAPRRSAQHSCHPNASLASIWNRHVLATEPLAAPRDHVVLTEAQVVRETLWLLSGVRCLFVYQLCEGKVLVRPGITVSHLTPSCLRAVCEQFASFGQLVLRLQKFVESVSRPLGPRAGPWVGPWVGAHLQGPLTPGPHGPGGPLGWERPAEDSAPCRTYQALAWALARYLQGFKRQLADVERRAICQERAVTLAMLQAELAGRFAELRALRRAFAVGVREVPPDVPHVVKASHLLNTLLHAVLAGDALGEAADSSGQLLLWLWLQTVRPYIEIIDDWITLGRLHDPSREFIIQRNDAERVARRDFWFSTYTLYCVCERNGAAGGVRRTPTGGPEALDEPTMAAFLRPVLKQLILAGKSTQLLHGPGLGGPTQPPHGWDRGSLYTQFCEGLEPHLSAPGRHGCCTPCGTEPACGGTGPGDGEEVPGALRVHMQAEHRDPLLEINFSRMFLVERSSSAAWDECNGNTARGGAEEADEPPRLRWPLLQALQRSLYGRVEQRYRACCGQLMATLKSHCRLLSHVKAMRSYFLMEAGDTMHAFCTALFCCDATSWTQPDVLVAQLQHALATHRTCHASRLSVSVRKQSRFQKRSLVHALDGLRLHYKVPWPLDIVISNEDQALYNDIFLFLLKVKWAKCSLEQLRFKDLQETKCKQQLQQASHERVVTEKGSGSGSCGGGIVAARVQGGTWRPRDAGSQCRLAPSPSRIASSGRDQSLAPHRMYLLRIRILHFVNSLHGYLLHKVLHGTWREFESELGAAADLDQLIHVHARYLAALSSCCLLTQGLEVLREALFRVLDVGLQFAACWKGGPNTPRLGCVLQLESGFNCSRSTFLNTLNQAVCQGRHPLLESMAQAVCG
ncbi:gamma-tubulin complex component 5-like isoform X2 [Petromyzon marinus]|uniref:gamma-tubulin complex component 5-like isoform X2 n=2 Tax=Petromyzon marinus TaxID=7757 RepID=UPI003F71A79E